MKESDIFKNIITDVKIEVTEEFDRNFERKAFFDKPWPTNKLHNSKGTMMARSNNLRRSIRSHIAHNSIYFSSSLPYAELQNNGGKIKVTPKMKKYFWAMHLLNDGELRFKRDKAGEIVLRQTKKNLNFAKESEKWKALALTAVGQELTVPERKFIGDHPEIHTIIKRNVERNMSVVKNYISTKLAKP